MFINNQIFTPKRYSSGELKFVKSELNKYIVNNRVEILYENILSFFELLLVIKYYNSKNVKINLILSYLPYQRMDHKDRDELDTLTFVKQILKDLNLDSITICEPHCQIEKTDNIKVISFIQSIKNKVFEQINFNQKDDYIVLTDKGGYRRYGSLSKNVVYFNKERDLQTGLIVKQEIVGEIKPNKKILIVDDIISTGDTIVNIVEYLSKQNFNEIYIMSGHIENNKYNNRLQKYRNVKQIFSTNSLKKRGTKKLKLFDIKEIIYG